VTPGTRKITLSAEKSGVEVLLSREEEEDALVPILDFVQAEVAEYWRPTSRTRSSTATRPPRTWTPT
jgi:hypothetical protein